MHARTRFKGGSSANGTPSTSTGDSALDHRYLNRIAGGVDSEDRSRSSGSERGHRRGRRRRAVSEA